METFLFALPVREDRRVTTTLCRTLTAAATATATLHLFLSLARRLIHGLFCNAVRGMEIQELLVQPDSDLDDDRRRDDNQNGATGSEFGGDVDPNPFCSRRLSNEPSFASYSHCYNERGDDTATFSDMGDVFDQRLVQARGVSEGKTANFEFVQELLVQPSSK
jgi:hypothetical protein